MYVWVMSKSYNSATGELLPVVGGYVRNYSNSGYKPNGFGLTWVSLDSHQLEFLQSGTDDRVEVVGKLNSKPTQLLLDTYADWLGTGTYSTVQDVLDKLGEFEPRFLDDHDERRP